MIFDPIDDQAITDDGRLAFPVRLAIEYRVPTTGELRTAPVVGYMYPDELGAPEEPARD